MNRYHGRLSLVLLSGLMALLLACTQAAPTTPPEPPPGPPAPPATEPTAQAAPSTPAPRPVDGAFSGQAAFEHVKHLAEVIGSRVAGTDNERKAADYIAQQLRGYGYTVDQPAVDFELADEAAAELEVVNTRSFPTNSLGFSASGTVTAPLVAVNGIGNPSDFPPSARGAVTLVMRGALSFADKVRNAADAGAVGVIVYNNEPGEFRGTLGRSGAASIPAVGVSGDAGQELLRMAQNGAQVRLRVEARTVQVRSRNVLARAGETCTYVIGGHYDSVPAGPGANDNASGTAVTLELARVLRPIAERAGLCFMAFGAEELGLWGSRIHVQGLTPEQRQAIRGMVNLDMVGVGDRWRISGSEALVGYVGEVAQALGIAVQLAPGGRGTGGGSDHASFLQAGIPAVFFYRMDDPNYHLPTDQAQFVDPAALEQAGKMVVGLVERLAGS